MEKGIRDMNTHVEGWYTTMKSHIDELAEKVNLSGDQVVEVLGYLGAGFIIGFLFKKLSTYVFIMLGVFILAVLGLESFNLITIDWTQVQALTGIGPSETIGGLFGNYLIWLKEHFSVVLGAVLGFLIGYRIG